MNSKPKLLYAEDNRLTAKEMTEILEEEGYEVVTTYSGDEAWETCLLYTSPSPRD